MKNTSDLDGKVAGAARPRVPDRAGPATFELRSLACACAFLLTAVCASLPGVELPPTGLALARPNRPAVAADAKAGLAGELDTLAVLIAERRKSFPAELAQGGVQQPSASLAEVWLASAALQVEKVRDLLALNPADDGAARQTLTMARDLLANPDPTAPPALVRHGRLVEYAYFTPSDGSPQPYFLYLPAGFTPDRRWPLVLFLHGWVPGTRRTNPYLVADFVLDLADKYGTVFAIPHGRTNTDFQYPGEMDVLRVKAEVEKFWPVDPERVCLLGISMGGAGAWEIGTHHPDLFAAITSINGQADWFRFWHEKFLYPPRAELPRHIQFLMALNNPLDLAENLFNLYSYSEHATLCFVGPAHTRDMVRKLRQAGAPCDTFEDPSPLGHNTYWQPFCWERAMQHFQNLTRTPSPARVRYVTYSPRFPGAYWARLEEMDAWGLPARIDAVKSGPGQLSVTTENVASLLLTPPAAWSDSGRFKLSWNGREIGNAVAPDTTGRIRLVRPDAPLKRAALRKNTAVCGPLSDVFNFPFVGVVGTAGDEAENRAAEELARQFATDWDDYAEGRVPLLRDRDVTDRLIQQKSLFLFGTPDTNLMLGRIASRLPFRLTRENVTLPDGKSLPMAGNGLIFCYPNPLAPDRYVVVYNGIPWGRGRSSNHKFDLLPDFAVYTPEQVPNLGINRYLAAGLFDANWQYAPALTDFAAAP